MGHAAGLALGWEREQGQVSFRIGTFQAEEIHLCNNKWKVDMVTDCYFFLM